MREWSVLKGPFRTLSVSNGPFKAVLLGVVAFGEALGRAVGAEVNIEFGLTVCLLALAGTIPLGLVRPVAAVVIVASAGFVSFYFLHVLTVGAAAVLVVAFVRVAEVGAQALAVPFVVLALVEPTVMSILVAAVLPAAGLAGVAAKAHKEALLHRAARQAVATTLVEHTVRGERARIARELHDVVAHHISMIAVQAETARLTTPGLPALGAQRFSEIGDRARAGLTEMRRLLGVLKEGTAVRAPQPRLTQLIDLLDDARQSANARLIVSGAPVPLDPGVELAAYRIVQEALTNARRHAPGAAVDVELRYGADTLRLRIRDNGPGPPTNDTGHGLTGMRERAGAVGGTLRTGPSAIGGFLVEAVLPVEAQSVEAP
jgi:signal transduction histidine kinase